MPTLNLLAEVLFAEQELNRAQIVIDRKRNSLFGKLPYNRSKLNTAQIMIDVQRIRIKAAKEYLAATE